MAKAKTVAQDEKEPTPATPSMAWSGMAPKWDMIDTLLGGTLAMRAAGDRYLPQHPAETKENYINRLHQCTLFNMTELTLDSLVGKPFSQSVKLEDDSPSNILNMVDNIDMLGSNLSTFCRHWFREGLAKAFCHVLVDMPRITPLDASRPRTLADDQIDATRPYWVFIRPENVIFAASTVIKGVEVLTHVRISETVVERIGFGEVIRDRIRVLEPGFVWLYELQEVNKKKVWVLIDQYEVDLKDVIPLVTFYSNRSGFMMGKPPLEDLAHLNIRHWQSTADQINVMTVARFPMLAVAGATDESGAQVVIGPRKLLGTKDANGRFYYVEHSGKAIEAGRNDLKDLEQQMASYGAQFLRRAPGGQTATARALDSAEAMSPLQDAVIRFVDCVNKALAFTAAWFGQKESGKVIIDTDFGPSEVNIAVLETLLAARQNGDISREDFLKRLKEMGILSEEFDSRVNLMRLMFEVVGAGLNPTLVNPDDIIMPTVIPDEPGIQDRTKAVLTVR